MEEDDKGEGESAVDLPAHSDDIWPTSWPVSLFVQRAK